MGEAKKRKATGTPPPPAPDVRDTLAEEAFKLYRASERACVQYGLNDAATAKLAPTIAHLAARLALGTTLMELPSAMAAEFADVLDEFFPEDDEDEPTEDPPESGDA